MARIRTIKPEFVESESIGRLSRDARLLFVLLWTYVDDSGRSRASSRMLASRLFPYDDDAPELMEGWLAELSSEGHIRLYVVDGSQYLDIPKWLEHQKIDHPARSRLPEFRDEFAKVSEDFAKPSENLAPHTLDLGPRTMDLGPNNNAPSGADGGDAEGDAEADAGDEGSSGGDGADRSACDLAREAWNDAAERCSWPKVQRLNAARLRALKARLNEIGGPDGWNVMLAKLEATPWLRHQPCCVFDWFLKPANLTKLMEGNYDDRQPAGPSAKQSSGSGYVAAFAGVANQLRDKQYRGF